MAASDDQRRGRKDERKDERKEVGEREGGERGWMSRCFVLYLLIMWLVCQVICLKFPSIMLSQWVVDVLLYWSAY